MSRARRLVLGTRVIRSCPKNSPSFLAAISIMFFVFGCHRDGNGTAGRAKARPAIDRAKAWSGGSPNSADSGPSADPSASPRSHPSARSRLSATDPFLRWVLTGQRSTRNHTRNHRSAGVSVATLPSVDLPASLIEFCGAAQCRPSLFSEISSTYDWTRRSLLLTWDRFQKYGSKTCSDVLAPIRAFAQAHRMRPSTVSAFRHSDLPTSAQAVGYERVVGPLTDSFRVACIAAHSQPKPGTTKTFVPTRLVLFYQVGILLGSQSVRAPGNQQQRGQGSQSGPRPTKRHHAGQAQISSVAQAFKDFPPLRRDLVGRLLPTFLARAPSNTILQRVRCTMWTPQRTCDDLELFFHASRPPIAVAMRLAGLARLRGFQFENEVNDLQRALLHGPIAFYQKCSEQHLYISVRKRNIIVRLAATLGGVGQGSPKSCSAAYHMQHRPRPIRHHQ